MKISFYKSLDLSASYTEDPIPCPEHFTMHAHFQAELFYFISGDAVAQGLWSYYLLQKLKKMQ